MPDTTPDQLTTDTIAPAEPETKDKSDEPQKVDNKKVVEQFRGELSSAKKGRKDKHSEWKRNVEIRIGKSANIYTAGVSIDDDIQSEINPDWALTKAKTANLYSQVPEVQGTHENKKYAAAISPFIKSLNYEIGEKRANIGVSMDEVLNDVVNAAGIGAIFCGYAARYEDVEVPVNDPLMGGPQPPAQPAPPAQPGAVLGLSGAGAPVPTMTVPRAVSDKFFATRVSPNDLLWPASFIRSNFNDGDWIGYSGRMSWAEAVNELDLKEDQKEKATGTATDKSEDSLRSDPERGGLAQTKVVKFDEMFYWRYRVDPDEKSFDAIWRIVFVEGIEEPVKHEPWKGQKFDEQSRKYIGAVKFPVQVLTLTYITDNPIPPSDSAAGRPQVNDLRMSRSQMFMNRRRSTPIRWFDVNRIDPLIQANLMRGTFQGMIPTNGDGSRSVGEIARASYPSEDLSFDQATKDDLHEVWQLGPNQLGTPQAGKKTGAEANIVQQNFATRIGQERAKVASFFLATCEVIAGLMVLNSDFPILSDQERQMMMQAWDQKHILHNLVLKIRPDSTIVIDAQGRLDKLTKFLNLTAKSGFIDVKPILSEMAELSGLDPAEVVKDPQPKPPEEPTISYRFSNKDDLTNVAVMAMLVHLKKAPSPQDIEEAKKILMSISQPPQPPQPVGPMVPGAGGPSPPVPPPPGAGGPAGPPIPNGPTHDAHPDWAASNKIVKRSRDING